MLAKKILAGVTIAFMLATPVTHAEEEDYSDEWNDIPEIPPESESTSRARIDTNPVSIQDWRREQFGDNRSNQNPPPEVKNPPAEVENPPENPPEENNPPPEVKDPPPEIENPPIQEPPIENPPEVKDPPNEIQPIENPPAIVEPDENPPEIFPNEDELRQLEENSEQNLQPIDQIDQVDQNNQIDQIDQNYQNDRIDPINQIDQNDQKNLPPVDENFFEMQNLPPIDENYFDLENQPSVDENISDDLNTNLTPEQIEKRQKKEAKKQRKAEKKEAKQFKKAVNAATYKALFSETPYIYLLNRESVEWKKVPYRMDEYMIDCWICIVESPAATMDQSALDMSILNDLDDKEYTLEHYLIRPAAKKIQFLSELEVVGYAQNTISERAYNDSHWQSLVPGSIEERIYKTVVQELGSKKASSKGQRSWKDILDDEFHISIT